MRSERVDEVVNFVLHFNYKNVIKFILAMMAKVDPLYLRFEKGFIKFIQSHWIDIREKILDVCIRSVDHIKIVYVLLKKLNAEEREYFIDVMPKLKVGQEFKGDLLKINFILVKGS